jgi:hypothetical protein
LAPAPLHPDRPCSSPSGTVIVSASCHFRCRGGSKAHFHRVSFQNCVESTFWTLQALGATVSVRPRQANGPGSGSEGCSLDRVGVVGRLRE